MTNRGKFVSKSKIIVLILLAPVGMFITFWVGSIIHAEILTFRHGYKFEEIHYEEPRIYNSIGALEYLKVLSYSETTARVYFVTVNRCGGLAFSEIGDRLGGHIFIFSNEDGHWEVAEQERVVWSKTGSADGFLWPYIR